MSDLNDLSLLENFQTSNDSFIQNLYSKISLKKKKGKSLTDSNIKYSEGIDNFEIWYQSCNFDKPKNWFFTNNFYYSNFFCETEQEAKDRINQYIKLSGLDKNLDSDIIASLNYLLTIPIKVIDSQGIVIFFIEYNLKQNSKFKLYMDKWRDQLFDEKEIYQQIFDQIKDKYMVRLYFDICKKDQILNSNIKLYFNNSFLKNYSYDITLISELIMKNNQYFKYFDKDIPLNSISLEYLFDVTKSYSDVYYPQVSVSQQLNKDDIDLSSLNRSLEINQDQFINPNILQDIKKLNDYNLSNLKLSLGEIDLLKKVKSKIDYFFDDIKMKYSVIFKKSNLDKVVNLKNFKNLIYPNWFTKYTYQGLKSQQNIDKYKNDYNKFNLENINLFSKFSKVNEIIENDKHHILKPNYLDKMLFQSFFDYNNFTLEELKKLVIQKLENSDFEKDQYIKQNKFNYNKLDISLTNYQLSNMVLESNIFIDGQILIYIPILNSQVKIFNIQDLLNQSLGEYKIKENDLDLRKWLNNSGFFKDNNDSSSKIFQSNNIHNFLNLVIDQVPAIFILVPINLIVNLKHIEIPFIKNLNFKEDQDINIPDKNFNKLELINLVKFLISNKQTIPNIVFNNPILDTSSLIKYYSYIIDKLNSFIKSIKSMFNSYSNKLQEDKVSKVSLILKEILNQYIKILNKEKDIYEKLIKKLSSWDNYIYY